MVVDSLLDGLNPQQRAAVLHEGSPLLIVAGAGSGKTRVLTHRIAYLLAERDVEPSQILAITFTNKAAGEMAARAASLTGARARSMWLMTFHSACVRILRREAKRFGYPSSFSIYDQADSQRLMAMVCRELELDCEVLPAEGDDQPGLEPEKRADRLRDRAGQGQRLPGEGARRGLRGVSAQAGGGRSDGLRRPDHGDGQPAAGVP